MRLWFFLCALQLFIAAPTVRAADINFEKDPETSVWVIYIEGDITHGDEKKFRDISLNLKSAIVVLNSDGGSLSPALEIGRIIRVAGYDTVVLDKSVCASSCALIWLAGVDRGVLGSGRVGFHAAYRDNQGRLEEVGAANALIGGYLTSLGLPTKAILFATSAPPDGILWLTDVGSKESGIDYNHYDQPDNSLTKSENLASVYPKQPAPSSNRDLIVSLSRSGEKWTKLWGFRNAYYDASSIIIERSKRQAWILYDYSHQDHNGKKYEIKLTEVDCKNGRLRVNRTVTVDRDSKGYSGFYEPAPGSTDKALMMAICAVAK